MKTESAVVLNDAWIKLLESLASATIDRSAGKIEFNNVSDRLAVALLPYSGDMSYQFCFFENEYYFVSSVTINREASPRGGGVVLLRSQIVARPNNLITSG